MNAISYAVDFWSKGEIQALFLRHEGAPVRETDTSVFRRVRGAFSAQPLTRRARTYVRPPARVPL